MSSPINPEHQMAPVAGASASTPSTSSLTPPTAGAQPMAIPSLVELWSATKPAPPYTPLEPGWYSASVTSSGISPSSNGKPRYSITFIVVDGPRIGFKLVRHYYLTAPAMPVSQRELAFFGVTDGNDLYTRSLVDVHCEVLVVLRKCDDGVTRNDIRAVRNILPATTQPGSAPNPFVPPPIGGGVNIQVPSTTKEGL